ncbi:MAG: type II toxin-antitoxin system RelE/ParE family toxin [Nitrospirae bacterium]|nr:type II toxin-antitoxin system RelE/ParE family toxin [Nitrospirota bacterium]
MRIKWLDSAIDDLVVIRRFIAAERPVAAREVASSVKKSVGYLAESPSIGRLGRVDGTRELVLPDLPYIVPYRVNNGMIEILRVLHAARKWPDRFEQT